MNIIVKPYGSNLCYCRPDTTWERENRDFHSPECVNEVLWTPVVFARVSKAGKCIGKKFAQRYYDGVGCGMLMYCRVMDLPVTSCVDHTSILPMPLYDPVVLEGEKAFEVMRNGESYVTLRNSGTNADLSTEQVQDDTQSVRCEWISLLEDALCKASQLTSLRIGDFIAVELAPIAVLASREDAKVSVNGTFCGNESFNFNILF